MSLTVNTVMLSYQLMFLTKIENIDKYILFIYFSSSKTIHLRCIEIDINIRLIYLLHDLR